MSNPAAVEADMIQPVWRVGRPLQGFRGPLAVPAAPELGLRAMALAALAVGPSLITGLVDARAERLAVALRLLGARVAQPAPGEWRIEGRGIGGLSEPAAPLPQGDAALLPLLAGLVGGHPIFAVLPGGEEDAAPLAALLAQAGARVSGRTGPRPPLAVEGVAEPLPLDTALPPDPEGWLATAALLLALAARGRSRLHRPVPAGMPELLHLFGAECGWEGEALWLDGQPELRPATLALPTHPTPPA